MHPFVFVPVFTHLHECFFFIPFICVWAAWKSKRWLLKEHDYVKSSRGKIEMYVMHIKYVSLTTKLTEVTGFLFRTSLEHAFSFAWKEKFFVLLSLLVWTPLWTSSDYPRLVWASQCMCTWRYAYERPDVIRIHICISPSQLYTDTMTRLVLKLKWQGKCVESLNMCSCLILKIQHEILPWFRFYLRREWKKNN